MTHLNESLRKAAVLIAALDVDAADAVLERLVPEQAVLLRRVMIELPTLVAGEEDSEHRRVSRVRCTTSRGFARSVGRGTRIKFVVDGARAVGLYRPEPTDESPTFSFLQDAADEDLAELF